MNETQSFDFYKHWKNFTRLLMNRQWTIITFFTVTLLVVVLGTSLQKSAYEAAATVLIDMETPSVLSVSTIRDETTVGQSNYTTYADYYRTQMEIIKSHDLAQRVFTNLNLGQRREYADQKDPAGALLDQVDVQPIKQTRLVQIVVDDPSPQWAARIANEFALVFAEENLAKTASTEAMTLMKNEYLKLQSKEAELSKRYKDKFPAVIRIRQQMEQLADAIEREMEKQLNYGRPRIGTSALTTEGPPKTLIERLRESSLRGGLRPNNIRVQDLAEIPTMPSKPKVLLNLLLGFFLGLFGGIGLAVFEELLDNSLKVPEDVERDRQFVLLGYVPQINGHHHPAQKSDVVGTLRERYQHIQSGSNTHAAEAYRSLRTNLLYATPHGNSRAVVITSPGSEEGKTTTVTNLGIALAQIGLKILLVDADLRRPRLHDAFQLAQKPGLSEYLIGQASFEKIIQSTGILNVWVVTSGCCPPNPAELLDLPQMEEFLKQATSKFDRIFLDTPPVIPVTDAVVLAAKTGAVIGIAQSGKTPRQALQRLNSVCNDVRAKLLGVILNNVSPRNLHGYGYGQKAYQYYASTPPSTKNKSKRSVKQDAKNR